MLVMLQDMAALLCSIIFSPILHLPPSSALKCYLSPTDNELYITSLHSGHLSEGGLCRVFTVGNCFVVVAVVISAGICFQCWKYVWKGGRDWFWGDLCSLGLYIIPQR